MHYIPGHAYGQSARSSAWLVSQPLLLAGPPLAAAMLPSLLVALLPVNNQNVLSLVLPTRGVVNNE